MTLYRCPHCGLRFVVDVGPRLRCGVEHTGEPPCCHSWEWLVADDGKRFRAPHRPDCAAVAIEGLLSPTKKH